MLPRRREAGFSEAVQPVVAEAVHALGGTLRLQALALPPRDTADASAPAWHTALRSVLVVNLLAEMVIGHALRPPAHIVGIARDTAAAVHGTGREPPERVVGVRRERHRRCPVVRE